MAKLSTVEIEMLAVHAINAEATKLNNMTEASIATRDTKVSFDGTIELFSDRLRRVSDWQGSVDVQVKGTEVKKFSNGNISFSLEIHHYKNYYTNGGVLFFVVEVMPNNKTKIYYKMLLLLDLKKIVPLNQKTKTITLTPLKGKTLRQVCEFYLTHKDLQSKFLIEQTFLPDSHEGEILITSPTYDPKKEAGLKEILNHEWYMYMQNGRNILPIESSNFKSLIFEEENWKISVGLDTFSFHVETHIEENIFDLIFDNTLKININEFTKKFTFQVLRFNSIHHQIKALSFLVKILEGEVVKVEEESFIALDITPDSLRDVMEEIKHNLQVLNKAKITMSKLGIDTKTIFSDMHEDTDRIYDRLEGLNRVILDEEYHLLDMKGSQYMLNLGIGQVSITMAWVPWHTEKVISAFSTVIADRIVYAGWDEDSKYMYTSYGLLSEIALAHACNINYEVIKRSFNNINPYLNDAVSEWTNKFCLKCITAYDLTKRKRSEVLYLALDLYNMNPYDSKNRDMDIQYINVCQIYKRLNGELSLDQKRQLIEIKHYYLLAENAGIHFGCNILIGNQDEAEYALQSMDKEEFDIFKNYPIYELYKLS